MARRPRYSGSDVRRAGFIRSVSLLPEYVPSFAEYPFSIPAIRNLGTLELHPKVTFLVGENGSGKSTLMEALADRLDLNPEGGTRNTRFSTRETESPLHEAIRMTRNPGREGDAFFLRAEAFFNFSTEIENTGSRMTFYGGSLHDKSHGEAFMALASNRFIEHGVYLLDEPEAAISPSRQLAFLTILDNLVQNGGAQFIIATHSPILMAYPDAVIYRLNEDGIGPVEYEDTEHYQITRDFLNGRERFFRHLLGREHE